MRLEQSFIAKYVDVASDGLFSVIGGGLTAIELSQLPGNYSTIGFLGRVVFDTDDEISRQTMTFRVTDAQGIVIEVPIPEPFGDTNKLLRIPAGAVIAHIAINLVNVPIRCFGDLEFALIEKDGVLGHSVVAVVERQKQNSSGALWTLSP